MTDVRLTALNPTDSQVYPVACNTSGELLVAGDGTDYLPLTGGDLTGDLTFNTDKITLNATRGAAIFAGDLTIGTNEITLNATSGTATFAGVVYSGGNAFNGGADGSRLSPGGAIYASAGSGNLWTGYTTGTTAPTSSINMAGAASFAAGELTIDINGSLISGGSSYFGGSIQTVGSGTFGGGTQVNGDMRKSTATGTLKLAVLDDSLRLFNTPVSYNDWTIYLGTDGSANFSGTVTATVVPPSDARFKENIAPAKPQLSDVVALGGILKNYNWNSEAPVNDEIRAQRQLGLIAQEAAEICPDLVKELGSEENRYKGIPMEALIMKLIGAVSELKTELDQIKTT